MNSAIHESRHLQMAALRAQLAEKFPAPATRTNDRLRTGNPALDQYGGLLKGSLTEVCGSAAGGQLILASLLETAAANGFYLGLIDGANAFEPVDWPEAQLRRMLWIMAGNAEASLKAADLLLRDGNLPIVVLDLQIVPLRQLRRIPASTWHRFQRVIAESPTVLTILTPGPMVEGAPCRIAVRLSPPLRALNELRTSLLAQLNVQIFERGRQDFSLRTSA